MSAPRKQLHHPEPAARAERPLSFWLPVLVLALLLPVAMDRAEAQPTVDSVTDYIQHTTDLLQEITDRVTEGEDPRALNILEEAWRLQRLAEGLLSSDRPLMAFRRSERARETARHAVQVARDARSFEERARQRGERAREILEGLFEQARDGANEPALRFLREAERQLRKAHEQYNQHNYELSLQLVESAEGKLQRAARLIFEGGGPGGLERLLERTHRLLDGVAEQLGDGASTEARRLLEQAEEHLFQAEAAFHRQQPLVTVQQARRARRLATRAGQLDGQTPGAEAVLRQIERFDERAGRLAEGALESGDAAVRRTLDQARRHRQQAQEELDRDQTEAALRQIRIAHDLLSEIESRPR